MIADNVSEKYHGRSGSPLGQRVTRERLHWMCRQVEGEKVLDVGCSQGIASIILGREGKTVVGIDIQESAVRTARNALAEEEELVRSRVEFRVGEVGALPVDDGSCDTVLLGEILEHLVDAAPALKEAWRALKRGGRLVVTVPYGIWRSPDHKDPVYLLPLLDALVETGFAAEQFETIVAGEHAFLALTASGVAPGEDLAPAGWRAALDVAEKRLKTQDLALEELRIQYRKLEERARTDRRRAADALKETRATEAAKRRELIEHEAEKRSSKLQKTVEHHTARIEALEARLEAREGKRT